MNILSGSVERYHFWLNYLTVEFLRIKAYVVVGGIDRPHYRVVVVVDSEMKVVNSIPPLRILVVQ
jgi:hypothetical protein